MIAFAEAKFAKPGAEIDPPEATAYLWDWYRDLSVSFGGMGGTAFHTEIVNYCALTGAEPTPWDVSMLRAVFRIHMASATKKPLPGERVVAADVDASDGAAVSGLLRGMGATRK